MPSWGEIQREIASTPAGPLGAHPTDVVRRKYMAQLHALRGRAVIVYATKWTIPGGNIPPGMLSVANGDIHGFMEALYQVAEDELDFIIHSPGGSAEAAEAIITYLRSKFRHIRVIVPHMAMSAATMLTCAADEIVMARHSFIGPIDPQIQLATALGVRFIPAQAIVEQFERAVADCADPAKVRAWLPMLQQYGPDLLTVCKNSKELSERLVSTWLSKYMFAGDPAGAQKAAGIAAWLADHGQFKSHSRYIGKDEARAKGLNIIDLEADPAYQDAVLSIYHATAISFGQGNAVKIIENHLGKTFIDAVNQQMMIAPMPAPPLPRP